jgi:hypothetical protein
MSLNQLKNHYQAAGGKHREALRDALKEVMSEVETKPTPPSQAPSPVSPREVQSQPIEKKPEVTSAQAKPDQVSVLKTEKEIPEEVLRKILAGEED